MPEALSKKELHPKLFERGCAGGSWTECGEAAGLSARTALNYWGMSATQFDKDQRKANKAQLPKQKLSAKEKAAIAGDGLEKCTEGDCPNQPARYIDANRYTLQYGGLCTGHGREGTHAEHKCACGRGNCGPVTSGIEKFKATGDTSAFRSKKCFDKDRRDERSVKRGGKLCDCGCEVSLDCPDGIRCEKCLRDHRNDGVPCAGPECDLPQHAVGLCRGHYGQHVKGEELRPLGEKGGGYSRTSSLGGWLYIVLGEGDGVPMFHGFGITSYIDNRASHHRREVPGLKFLYRFWWSDANVAADIERGWTGRLGEYNGDRPGDFKKEAFPVCVDTVAAMVAEAQAKLPDETIEGDSK